MNNNFMLNIDYTARMEELVTSNTDLTKHSQFLEQEQLLMRVSALFNLYFNQFNDMNLIILGTYR